MFLLIDASTKSIGLALADDDKVLCNMSLESGRTHSVDLMPSIDFVLQSTGVKLGDLSGLIVSNGPGSFTGLRIAMSTVKALSHPFNLPIYAASTLRALSFYGRYFDGMICPIMDARRSRVYTTLYDQYLGKQLIDEQTMEISSLVEIVKEQDKDVIFVGDGISVYKSTLIEQLGAKCTIGDIDSTLSNGVALLYAHKAGFTDCYHYANVAVNYVRKPQAERERENNDSKVNEIR